MAASGMDTLIYLEHVKLMFQRSKSIGQFVAASGSFEKEKSYESGA